MGGGGGEQQLAPGPVPVRNLRGVGLPWDCLSLSLSFGLCLYISLCLSASVSSRSVSLFASVSPSPSVCVSLARSLPLCFFVYLSLIGAGGLALFQVIRISPLPPPAGCDHVNRRTPPHLCTPTVVSIPPKMGSLGHPSCGLGDPGQVSQLKSLWHPLWARGGVGHSQSGKRQSLKESLYRHLNLSWAGVGGGPLP